MKPNKQPKIDLAEVKINGDLKDIKKLISSIKKKKTLLIFKDVDQGSYYSMIENKIKAIKADDLTRLEKKHQLVTLSFFPGKKKMKPIDTDKVDTPLPVPVKRVRNPKAVKETSVPKPVEEIKKQQKVKKVAIKDK